MATQKKVKTTRDGRRFQSRSMSAAAVKHRQSAAEAVASRPYFHLSRPPRGNVAPSIAS